MTGYKQNVEQANGVFTAGPWFRTCNGCERRMTQQEALTAPRTSEPERFGQTVAPGHPVAETAIYCPECSTERREAREVSGRVAAFYAPSLSGEASSLDDPDSPMALLPSLRAALNPR